MTKLEKNTLDLRIGRYGLFKDHYDEKEREYKENGFKLEKNLEKKLEELNYYLFEFECYKNGKIKILNYIKETSYNVTIYLDFNSKSKIINKYIEDSFEEPITTQKQLDELQQAFNIMKKDLKELELCQD